MDNFSSILGSTQKEDKLLTFAKRNNFNTLILYQLNKVDNKWSLTDPIKNVILSEFIAKAKNKFDILNVGASGESATFFTNKIDVYNNTRTKKEEKFDIYNLEFEYWSKKASGIDGYYCVNYLEENALPCTREGSFTYFIDNLKELKRLSKNNKHPIKTEAYVGFFSKREITEITKYCDRLLLHAYGKNPKECFTAAKRSLTYLYQINSKTKTSLLISTRMNDMGYWLKYDNLKNAETELYDEMNKNNVQLKKNLNLDGFAYHTYSFLEKSVGFYSYRNN